MMMSWVLDGGRHETLALGEGAACMRLLFYQIVIVGLIKLIPLGFYCYINIRVFNILLCSDLLNYTLDSWKKTALSNVHESRVVIFIIPAASHHLSVSQMMFFSCGVIV